MRVVRRAIFLVVAMVAGQSFAAELASDPEVRGIFSEVLRRGFFGLQDVEKAAFVIRDGDGRYISLVWPDTGLFHSARYPGAIPRGTVAIVHTHPVSLPMPSPQDRVLAMHLNMPIYIVTLMNVYEADERGNAVVLIRNRRWLDEAVRSRQIVARPACDW